MNPLRLRVQNYRTFADLDLHLPDGVCAIVGPNGAGKSSIVNAIDLALFGPQSRSLADCLTHDALDDLLLELEFDHAGELYRVRRTYSPRGRGRTSVDFEQLAEPLADANYGTEWRPLTRESARETDALIVQTIGLTRETFRASAFLAQGDGAAFTDAQPRDRKRILCDVLQLDRWQAFAELAHTDRKTAETELQRLNGSTAAAQAVVDGKHIVESDHQRLAATETEAAGALAAAEAALEQVSARFVAAREAVSARAAAEAELATSRTQLDLLVQAQAKAQAAAAQITEARDELAALGPAIEIETLQAQIDAARERVRELEDSAAARARDAEEADRRQETLEQRRTELAALRAKVEQLRTAADALDEQELPTCDRCGQGLDADARARARKSYDDEAGQTLQRANGIEEWCTKEWDEIRSVRGKSTTPGNELGELEKAHGEFSRLRDEHAAALTANAKRATLEERIRACEQTIRAEPDLPDRIANAAALVDTKTRTLDELEPVDLAAIETEGAAARARVTEERGRLTAAQTEKARIEERLALIVKAERKLAENAARTQATLAEIDLASNLERAFGPSGIPALILENAAIPQLEATANELLRRLGGKTAAATVELRTQAENKDGTLRDALDVIVITDTGAEQAYEAWSGGEKSRLNIALRLALAELLAHRRGAESRVFVIDEIDGLDAQGKTALVEILHGMHERGIERVYLVSHDAELREAVEQAIAVEGDGDRSWIAATDEREPVVT